MNADRNKWDGILAPARTPRPIVLRLNAEIVRLVQNAEAQENAANQGSELIANTPQEFAAYIGAQIERYAKVVKATGMRPD